MKIFKGLKECIIRVKAGLPFYALALSGTIASAFAITAPALVGSMGVALDLSKSYQTRERLCAAIDNSAVSAAATYSDEGDLERRLQELFTANFPDKVFNTDPVLGIVITDDEVIANVTVDYSTSFIRLVGVDSLTISCVTEVNREVRGLEVVLVLDNTGSMGSNNNIETLREASKQFVDILFDKTSNPDFIKVGIVPYATAVNVGPYGICKNPDGSSIANCTPFVDLPEDMDYTTNRYDDDNWFGCVLAYNEDVEDRAWSDGIIGSQWDDDLSNHDADPFDTQDLDPSQWNGSGDQKWAIYRRERYGCTGYHDGSCHAYGWQLHGTPNSRCTRTAVMPLSSERDDLKAHLDTMYADGYTLGNLGMVWGYRMLSPEAPFTEGADWDDTRWKKVIVMMTDGINTMTDYTAYGRNSNHNVNVNALNEKFADTCNAFKVAGAAVNNDVYIYTITFESGVNESTKEYYRNCATTAAYYYDAPTQEALGDVFERIANELSIIYING